MRTSKEKKTDSPDKEWSFESPVGPDTARTRAILDTIPDEVVPGWRAKSEDKDDVYDRAMLAAQGRPRDQRQTAERLLREAEFEVGEKRLEASAEEADASPQSAVEQREAWDKYLNDPKHAVGYEDGAKLITGRQKWDDALKGFKQTLAAKAERDGESETWVDMTLKYYRKRGFTLVRVKELQEEFRKLSGYRGQGKVLNKETDGRLKVNRKKKLAKLQKAQKLKSTKAVHISFNEAIHSIPAAGVKAPLRGGAY
jgi:hypothetical protein